jgi:hypothetical protein
MDLSFKGGSVQIELKGPGSLKGVSSKKLGICNNVVQLVFKLKLVLDLKIFQ